MKFEHTESAVALIGLDRFGSWLRSRSTASCISSWRHRRSSLGVRDAAPGRCGRAVGTSRSGPAHRRRRVVAVWRKCIWRCPDSDCDVATCLIARGYRAQNRRASADWSLLRSQEG